MRRSYRRRSVVNVEVVEAFLPAHDGIEVFRVEIDVRHLVASLGQRLQDSLVGSGAKLPATGWQRSLDAPDS